MYFFIVCLSQWFMRLNIFLSGFCHFGLVLFMVLWQSPDTPVMSRFSCERAACISFYRLRAFVLYLVLCGTQLVYSLAACFHVVMSCVNTWLMSFLISCVFMSCFAHGWWFVCWPCACVSVLCEHVASVLVFCVPCAHVTLSWPHPSCYLFID